MKTWEDYKYMDNRKKILFLLVLLIIVLLIFLGYLVIKKITKSTPPAPQISIPTEVIEKNFVDPINPINLQQEINSQNQEKDLSIIAEPFVERFGSYNNQDNFKNFNDIVSFMTPSLNSWVFNTYLDTLKDKLPSINAYYSINTKVLSSELITIDKQDGKATILINTQRQELGAQGKQINLFYQEVRVEMLKVNTEWKVNGVYWL